MALIEVRDLGFDYGEERSVLREINLEIEAGTYLGVVGSNGSGKSTFTKQLNALLFPSRGEVLIEGISTQVDPAHARDLVGMVLQNPENQIVGTVVEDDVAFGPENLQLEVPAIRQRVEESLRRVGLWNAQGRGAETLSGGQKQRLAIAGVLAMRPKIMVIDEPTSMLDPVGRREVLDCIRDLNRTHGITILHVTHLLEELFEADRVIALEEGRLAFDGTVKELFADGDLMDRLKLEVPPPVRLSQAWDAKAPGAELPWDFEEAVEALAGTEVGIQAEEAEPPEESKAKEEPLVRFSQVGLEYGVGSPFHVVALDAIDWVVRPGEFLGLLGATGSGKSSLIQVLARLISPSRGERDYADFFHPTEIFRNVGVVFQQPEDQLFERTVYDDIAYGPSHLGLEEEEVRERVLRSLEALGLKGRGLESRSPFELSGGEKRRVAIAGILAMEPDLLVLDEPTAGLDAAARNQLLERLGALHQEQGKTIVVVSHDMELLARWASRLVVLQEGRILRQGRPEVVFEDSEDLFRAGLVPPYAARISEGLRKRGMGFPRATWDLERLVGALEPRGETKKDEL